MEDTNKENKVSVNQFSKGLSTDTSPITQPEGTLRFALNAVDESEVGDSLFPGNAESNEISGGLKEGYIAIGKVYTKNGETVIFSVKPNSNPILTVSEIGVYNDKTGYSEKVNDTLATDKLNFSVDFQIDAVYRLRRGCDDTIYWTDNNNPVRSYVLNRPEDYLVDGVFSAKKASLFERFSKVPRIDVDVIEQGDLLPGSYNMSIQYLDSDLNPTEWITVSETVIIYNDSLSNNFSKIRGSTNEKNVAFDFPKTNKAISVKYTNIDTTYPFVRIALIEATNGSGSISKVTATLELPVDESGTVYYVFNGTNTFTELPVEEIAQQALFIDKAQSIEQVDNMLLLGGTKSKNNNLCDLQAYASKIVANYELKTVVLDSITEPGNPKRPTANLESVGYMPGEIYSFGIVYVFKDGTTSPVYHIPGKGAGDSASNMSDRNTCLNTKYVDRSNCGGDFWKVDNRGQSLKNTPIRHHRFPTRKELNKPLIEKTTVEIEAVDFSTKIMDIIPIVEGDIIITDFNTGLDWVDPIFGMSIYCTKNNGNNATIVLNCGFDKDTKVVDITSLRTELDFYINGENKLKDVASITGFSTYIVDKQPSTVFTELERYTPAGGILAEFASYNYNYKVTFTDKDVMLKSTVERTLSEIMGINFSNISLPENAMGYYIVRNEREDNDKSVLDSGILLPVNKETKLNFYNAFGNIMPTYPTTVGSISQTGTETTSIRQDAYCLIYPEFLFNKKEFQNFNLEKQGDFKYSSDRIVLGMTRDVMAGTSYNPKVHSKDSSEAKNEDGFDLRTVTKVRQLNYVKENGNLNNINSDEIKSLKYIKALSSINLENIDIKNTFFNICTDNNIAFLEIKTEKSVFEQQLKSITTKYDMTVGIGAGIAFMVKNSSSLRLKPYDEVFDDIKESHTESQIDALDALDAQHADKVYGESTAKTINNYPFYYLTKDNIEPYSDFRSRNFINISNNYYQLSEGSTEGSVTVFGGDSYVVPLNFFTSYYQAIRFADRKKKNNLWKKIAAIAITVAGAALAIFTGGASLALTVGAVSMLGIGAAISVASVVIEQSKISEIYDKEYAAGLKHCLTDAQNDYLFNTERRNPEFLYSKDNFFAHRWSNDDEIQWSGNMLQDLWFETSVNINWRNGNTKGLPDFINPLSSPTDKQIRDYFVNKLTVVDAENESGRLYTGFALAEQYLINKDFMRRNSEKPLFALGIEYDCCSDCVEEFSHRIHYSEQSFQEELTDNYKIFLPNNYRDIDGETGAIVNIFKLKNNIFIHTEEGLWNMPKNYQERITDQIVSFIGTGSFFEVPPQKIVDDDTGNSYGTYHKWSRLKTPYGYFFVCESQNAICQFDGNKVKAISDSGMYYWFYNNIPMDDAVIRDNPSNPEGSGFIGVFDSKKGLIVYTKKHIVNGVNKSWTISYNLKKATWSSFHSFLPYFYIQTPQYYFSIPEGSNGIWRHNAFGKYQEYYGKKKPFIIEYVITDSPLTNRLFENLTVFVETKKFDATTGTFHDVNGVFFDKLLCYNSRQISGVVDIIVKDKRASDFFDSQVENILSSVIADRNERNWTINELRDMSSGVDKPLFIEKIDEKLIQDNYFIDKVINPASVNFQKEWYEIESFRDKYLVVRLTFNKFADDVKMITNFTVSNETVSGR